MNANKLVVFWSKREQDFLVRYPRSADGHLANSALLADTNRTFEGSFVQQLKDRGYDLTTLRFSVERSGGTPKGESK